METKNQKQDTITKKKHLQRYNYKKAVKNNWKNGCRPISMKEPKSRYNYQKDKLPLVYPFFNASESV